MYEIEPAQDQPDLVVAELLGVINKMSHSNKRLEGIIKAYQDMARSYDHKGAILRDERDRARALAAMLENECANCWGPIHSMSIKEARFQATYQYPVDPFLTGEDAEDGA
jgi:hypothetical protein